MAYICLNRSVIHEETNYEVHEESNENEKYDTSFFYLFSINIVKQKMKIKC